MATTITIADLFPDDHGMILVAKDGVDGLPRHISEVTNGAACGCVCFGCGRRLIARNGGDIRAHSFAHRYEDMVIDCFSSGETALHLRAKEIIASHRRITLPPSFVAGLDGQPIEVTPEVCVALRDVTLEAVVGEVIPDVTATMPDGRRLFIEITNTHPCTTEKIAKLDLMGVEVLEIMVSSYRAVPLDELDDIILDKAPRKLIHSSEAKAKAAEIAGYRQQLEEAKRAEAQRLVGVYRSPSIHNHLKAQTLTEDLVQLGLAEYMDLKDERPSAFIIYRRQWQAVVLDRLYRAQSEFLTPMDIIQSFANAEWPKKEIAYTTSEHSRWIAANIADDFKSPYEEVLAYLSRLHAEGAVYEIKGKGFGMSRELFIRIGAAIEKRERPERRINELKMTFRDIGSLMLPADGRMPSFDAWLKGRAVAVRLSVEQLLIDETGKYTDLTDRMKALYRATLGLKAYKKVDQPEDLVGLPVHNLVNRLMTAIAEKDKREKAEWDARLQRQKAEEETLRKQEAADRVFRIAEAALFWVHDVELFLDTPLPEHNDRTPRELASESYQGFNQAQAILSKIRHAEQAVRAAENLKRDVIGKLWEQAYSRIPRREIADLWPRQSWPELGGAKPLDYCKDEKTLKRCLEVLEDFVASERKRGRR
ncbi:hypothetical protein HFO09_30400 [Rhizobium laguerreae]|uniref:hypothetical protein n=1 Tax=Rhizobium laguerreae TaxID=1076926 RepID=UPI001C928D39|nr:hypothetical protein [Rhizobium laguerreae]MBY3258840.1 hypothetical protein [Rhizobium laguerreae]MBY3282019.1 hypothetical protein [Rhizobium laguerreae]MBY3293309.1 hypothetical protein [Rhizobium laguerreae]